MRTLPPWLGSTRGSSAARWAPHWPDGHPEYVRLDLSVPEFGTPHNSITSLGAVPLDPVEPPTDPDDRPYRIYADPAGHPFSLHLN